MLKPFYGLSIILRIKPNPSLQPTGPCMISPINSLPSPPLTPFSLILLQTQGSLCWSLNKPRLFLPQGLCTVCSLCLPPTHMAFPHLLRSTVTFSERPSLIFPIPSPCFTVSPTWMSGPHWQRFFFFCHCFVFSIQNSDWHTVGTQYKSSVCPRGSGPYLHHSCPQCAPDQVEALRPGYFQELGKTDLRIQILRQTGPG